MDKSSDCDSVRHPRRGGWLRCLEQFYIRAVLFDFLVSLGGY